VNTERVLGVSSSRGLQVWSGSLSVASCGSVLCMSHAVLSAGVCLLFLQHAVCCASAQFLLPAPAAVMPPRQVALCQHRASVIAVGTRAGAHVLDTMRS
jgi:hypothetical protein